MQVEQSKAEQNRPDQARAEQRRAEENWQAAAPRHSDTQKNARRHSSSEHIKGGTFVWDGFWRSTTQLNSTGLGVSVSMSVSLSIGPGLVMNLLMGATTACHRFKVLLLRFFVSLSLSRQLGVF